MSFFDKFFAHKSRSNKNDNELNNTEPLGFRPSTLKISKDQIRFLLFRECDRRGRKLLFDSSAVEKILLTSADTKCDQESQRQNIEKGDFIEITKTHGYKYKKPPNDIALLGEMMFGSVAMIYKGENSCKIHSIPSPKQLMFTSIIHAPNHSCVNINSETSVENSCSSIDQNKKETSSSDSKLYTHKEEINKHPSTYPDIKNPTHLIKISQYCDFSDIGLSVKDNMLNKSSKTIGVENSSNNQNSDNHNFDLIEEKKVMLEKMPTDEDCLMLNLPPKNSDCELESNINIDGFPGSSLTSFESDNISNNSGSSSSLRRRWAKSYATSLDFTTYQGINYLPCKKKAKLGMALLLNLSSSENHDLEQFLFNHTIIIDSIMKKLQSAVELAYINNQNFVNLLYNAFLESQQSIYELITNAKCPLPIWITLLDDQCENKGISKPLENKFKLKNMSESTKLKFMNDFCDVLVKFDTKDTNFFISTLLTAVLTHHLSWVSTIAENDDDFVNNCHQKTLNKLGPYNPIWAQLNDLCGLLGSPLKCAKTVITGAENKRYHIIAIIQVLTYFIRCYSIVENIYDIDIESIMELTDEEIENLSCSKSSCTDKMNGPFFNTQTTSTENYKKNLVEKTNQYYQPVNAEVKIQEERTLETCVGIMCNLKRSKSCLAQLKLEDSLTSDKIYPNIEELAKSENVFMEDLDYPKNDKKIMVNDFKKDFSVGLKSSMDLFSRENKTHLDIPGPDKDHDIIGSIKTDDTFLKKIEIEKQKSASKNQKDVVFVLGENEELKNLQKKVVITKSDLIEIENEETQNLVDNNKTFIHVNTCVNSEQKDGVLKNESSENKVNFEKPECRNVIINSSHESKINSVQVPWISKELEMPRSIKSCTKKTMDVSSVFGSVKENYNSEQIIQGVLQSKDQWKHKLQKDLFLCAHSGILEKNVSEALCILGDVDSWEVLVFSSNTSVLDRSKNNGVRVGMSQLVADMLESFLCLHKINLSPNFCLLHIEKKLHEIYSKSKTVAEVLSSTNLCSIDFLTTRLDIEINDVPLLLSVATTHSPHISEKYGLSFT